MYISYVACYLSLTSYMYYKEADLLIKEVSCSVWELHLHGLSCYSQRFLYRKKENNPEYLSRFQQKTDITDKCTQWGWLNKKEIPI